MEMKSEVGVCSEDEVGGGEGEAVRRSKWKWGYMRQSRCDRVDATESMRQSRWNGGHTYVSNNGVKQVGVYSEAVVGGLCKQVRSGQWVGLEATGAIT